MGPFSAAFFDLNDMIYEGTHLCDFGREFFVGGDRRCPYVITVPAEETGDTTPAMEL